MQREDHGGDQSKLAFWTKMEIYFRDVNHISGGRQVPMWPVMRHWTVIGIFNFIPAGKHTKFTFVLSVSTIFIHISDTLE